MKRINFRNLQKLLKRDIVIVMQLDCTDTSTSKCIQSVDDVDVIQNHETHSEYCELDSPKNYTCHFRIKK